MDTLPTLINVFQKWVSGLQALQQTIGAADGRFPHGLPPWTPWMGSM